MRGRTRFDIDQSTDLGLLVTGQSLVCGLAAELQRATTEQVRCSL